MKLLTNSKILLVTLSRLYSGDFDPENVYRKPPVILKTVPEAGKFRILLSSWNIKSDAGFGTILRIRNCFQRSKHLKNYSFHDTFPLN
jgi:hypothetical protein